MPQRPEPRIAKVAQRIVASIAVALFAIELWLFRDYLIDDTFISLRYARNLAEGLGPVFNRGEYVEGYTNPSFVLLSALCFSAGIDPIGVTRLVSFAAAAVILILLPRLEQIGPRCPQHPRAALYLIAGPAFAYWAVASFETVPFTAIFIAALWTLWGEGARGSGHRSTVLWIALSLTRPEGMFLFGVSTFAFALADSVAGAGAVVIVRRHAVNVAVVAAGMLPHFVWRFFYYGSLVPNTFHAKVTGGSEQVYTGLKSLGLFAAGYPLHAAATMLAFALVTPAGRVLARRFPYAAAVAFIATIHVTYVALIGGDFMPYFRFFQPVLPLASLLLVWALASLPVSSRRRNAIALAALVATMIASHATTQRLVAFVSHRTTLNGIRVGKRFAKEIEPSEWIAVNTAGAIPFYSKLPSIDMLGLTDAAIARRQRFIVSTGWAGHRKGWGSYVMRRRPQRILWYNTAGSREPFYLGDHELADNPYFRFFYRLKTSTLPPASDGEPLGVFLGSPFGHSASGRIRSPELGFEVATSDGGVATSTIYETSLQVHSFDRDDRLLRLWQSNEPGQTDRRPGEIRDLVAAAAQHWQTTRIPRTVDEDALRQVEAICDRAQHAARAGDLAKAKSLLATAADRNEKVQSPLVYQYIANVAVLSGEPFVAIAAQKEALRLQPDSELYRTNLVTLLTKPYKDLGSHVGGAANSASTASRNARDAAAWRASASSLSQIASVSSGRFDPRMRSRSRAR